MISDKGPGPLTATRSARGKGERRTGEPRPLHSRGWGSDRNTAGLRAPGGRLAGKMQDTESTLDGR